MATMNYPRSLDVQELIKRIQGWSEMREFETKVVGDGQHWAVKARKSSWFRAAMAADRAINVNIRTDGEKTEVVVGQGDWTTNLASNAVWLAVTGGAWLAISGWSFVVQWQLEGFIRQQMEEMGSRS
jgi:hypothetical protein